MVEPQTAVETLAHALAQCERGEWIGNSEEWRESWRRDARALLAEITPEIRADALEEAARVADEHAALSCGSAYDAGWKRGASCIAAAIRERARG